MELGNHEARPIKYEFGKSSKKQTEMVTLTFVFVGGPNEGKRITYNGYFNDATAKRTLDSLEHCGWDGASLKAMSGFGSKNVELVVKEEEGQDGEMYPRVAWVNRLFSRGPGIVYSPDEVDSLDARLQSINQERRAENAEKRGEPKAADPFGNG